MLAAVVYLFAMYLGYLVSAQLLGGILLRKLRRPDTHPIAAFALGLTVLLIAGALPVLGSLLGALASLAGFGALWLLLQNSDWYAARFRRAERSQSP